MDTREAPRLTTSEAPGGGMMVGPTNSYGGASGGGSSGNGVPSNNTVVMPPSSAGMMPGMRLSFNHMPPAVPVSRPMDPPAPGPLYQGDTSVRPSGLFNLSEPVKKKRGRPRKYGPDGSMALALSPLSSAPGYSNNSSPMTDPSAKRRGRPPGSGKKQQLEALGSAGIAFTPHVITVKAGEDVASKIMAFSQQGSRTVCILSANGAISNVTLRQPATSGGTVTYEGRFEIISLSGSYLLTENNGTRSRTGGLSVALAGSDGRVLGGGVAGMLMAAAPVQVVVGSFIAEGKKPKHEPLKPEPSSAPPQVAGFGAGLVASPPSRGTSSESSDDPGSPINHSGGVSNNSGQHVHSMPSYTPVSWSHTVNQHRHDSDMKMMP